MGYLAAYIPLCLSPLAMYAIWRQVDRSLPLPVALLCGYAWALVLLGVFGVAAAAGWGGCAADPEPSIVHCSGAAGTCARPFDPACPDRAPGTCSGLTRGQLYCPAGMPETTFQYCEQAQPGTVAQEQSTWSDLAFIASGLFIFMMLDLDRRKLAWQTRRRSFMVGPSVFSILYATVVVFMGPASMFLHAGMKAWGGFFDNFSIMLWVWFGIAYSGSRWGLFLPGPGSRVQHDGWSVVAAIVFLTGLVVTAALSLAYPETRQWNTPVYGGLWATNEIAQWTFLASQRRFKTDAQGTWAAILLVLIAGLLLAGVFGFKEWCASPTSALQGHPLFHTFAAVATFLAFLLWRLMPEAPEALG